MDRTPVLADRHRIARRLGLPGLVVLALTAALVPGAAADPIGSLPPALQSGKFIPATPTRILDTRTAVGVPAASPVGAGKTIKVATGLPAHAKAVVLNVTATGPTADSYLTVYPDGTARPGTSNLNFRAGQTVPNLVTVPVSNGYVDFYNLSGSTDIAADLAGYYTDDVDTTGSSYLPVTPGRVLDTRTSTPDRVKAPIPQGGTLNLKVAGRAGVPQGATAVVLNVTATNVSAGGYLTVYPHGTTRPGTSNLNFVPKQTVPNLVTVPLGADGSVDLYNFRGDIDAVADVFGYYESAPTGAGFGAVTPKRLLDTRDATGVQFARPVAGGEHVSLRVSGVSGIPDTGTVAVVLNVTATRPTSDGYLTVSPSNAPRPATSNLNFTAGQTVSNLVVVPVGNNGFVDFYNSSGAVDVVADVFGYFLMPLHGPTDLKYGVPYEGAPSCYQATPGVIQPHYLTATDRVFDFSAQFFPAPGATAEQWGQFVLTGPDGETSFPTSAFGTGYQSGQIHNLIPGATYTWYAFSRDPNHSSEPSLPCTFRVGTNAVPDPPKVTTDAWPIHVGDTVTFTITGSTASTAPGDQMASFRYCTATGCATVNAVNNSATFTYKIPSSSMLAISATATTIVGQPGMASSTGWGITPN